MNEGDTAPGAARAAPHIAAVTLDERSVLRRNREIEQERAAAIADLLHTNRFVLASGGRGPFHLHLAASEGRLTIDVRSAADGPAETITLPLQAFRGLIRDYFLICESYYKAVRSANLAQVEAIDMGRRGLHDEAAGLLIERLADRVEIDHATARRLFTLICVLHLKATAHGLGPHRRS